MTSTATAPEPRHPETPALRQWLRRVLSDDELSVTAMDIRESAAWAHTRGAIRHNSGRFFNVVGVRGEGVAQPLLEQREIGTLCFVFRAPAAESAGPEVLVQAKVEPGNIGGAQLAPSLQATASNLERLHGGTAPPGAEFLHLPGLKTVSSSLQSEQGSRFLCKNNRNLSLSVSSQDLEPGLHRWLPVRQLLQALHEDCLVNTDARSVLVCTPWEFLAGNEPFAGSQPLAAELRRSFLARPDGPRLHGLMSELERLRAAAAGPRLCALEEVPGVRVEPSGLVRAEAAGFLVRHVQVHSRSREVKCWDQPIVDSLGEGRAELFAARLGKVLHFGFQALAEPGLSRHVELGPSQAAAPGEPEPVAGIPAGAVLLAACRQSDEGGRFYQDVTTYRLWDLGEARPDSGLYWLTLADICALLRGDGVFTNEARTLLSLVLRHL